MAIYHAYEISTHDNYDLWVDTDPAALLLHMAEDLKDADNKVERITIGKVEGDSIEDALNSIRAGGWLKEGFGEATCVSPEEYE